MFDFLINKKTNVDVDTDLDIDIPNIRMSEGMIRRDNFFHSCWTHLKSERPDLWEEMGKVEMFTAGYNPNPESQDDIDKKEKEKDERIIL